MSYDMVAAKQIEIETVAQRLGLDINSSHKTRCISQNHKDNSPSLSFNRQLNRFKCFGCDLSGDVIDLVQIVMGFDFKAAINWLDSDSSLPLVSHSIEKVARVANPKLLASFHAACDPSGDWLAHKGLDASRFGVRRVTKAAHAIMPSFPVDGLFVPYYQHGIVTGGRVRNVPGAAIRFLSVTGVDVILYNQDALHRLDGVKALHICEGETDTMSLDSMGEVAIGFPGGATYSLIPVLASWLKALGPRIPAVVLAIDHDNTGNLLNTKLRDMLADFPDVAITEFDTGGHKDINDWYNASYLPTKP